MVINTTLADVNSDCSLDMSTDELLTDNVDNTTVCHVTVIDRSVDMLSHRTTDTQ